MWALPLICRGEGQAFRGSGGLTQLVIPRVVGDLHGVDLQPAGALPQTVRAGDGGALLVYHLHQLRGRGHRSHSPAGSTAAPLQVGGQNQGESLTGSRSLCRAHPQEAVIGWEQKGAPTQAQVSLEPEPWTDALPWDEPPTWRMSL